MGRGSGAGGGGGGRSRAKGGGGGGAEPPKAAAQEPQKGMSSDALFDAAKKLPGAEGNLFSISDLHDKFPGMPLKEFQAHLIDIRKAGHLNFEAFDGRHGSITEKERTAQIHIERPGESESMAQRSFTYVSFRGGKYTDQIEGIRQQARAERAAARAAKKE